MPASSISISSGAGNRRPTHLPLVGLRFEVRQQPGEDRGEPLVVVVGHQQVQRVGPVAVGPVSISQSRSTHSPGSSAVEVGGGDDVRVEPRVAHRHGGGVHRRLSASGRACSRSPPGAGSPPRRPLVRVSARRGPRVEDLGGRARRHPDVGHRHVEHPLGDLAHRPLRLERRRRPSSPVNSNLPWVGPERHAALHPGLGCPRGQRLPGLLGAGWRCARCAAVTSGPAPTARRDGGFSLRRRNPPGSNTRTSPRPRRRAMVVSIRSRLTDSKIAGPTQSNTAGMAHSAVLPERVGPTMATDVTSPGRPWRRRRSARAINPAHPASGFGAHRWLSVATSHRPHVPRTNRPGTGRRTSSGRSSRRVAKRAWASTPRRRRWGRITPHSRPRRPAPHHHGGAARSPPNRRRAGQRRRRPIAPATPPPDRPGSPRSDGTPSPRRPNRLEAQRRPWRRRARPRPTPPRPPPRRRHTTRNTDSPGVMPTGPRDLSGSSPHPPASVPRNLPTPRDTHDVHSATVPGGLAKRRSPTTHRQVGWAQEISGPLSTTAVVGRRNLHRNDPTPGRGRGRPRATAANVPSRRTFRGSDSAPSPPRTPIRSVTWRAATSSPAASTSSTTPA